MKNREIIEEEYKKYIEDRKREKEEKKLKNREKLKERSKNERNIS